MIPTRMNGMQNRLPLQRLPPDGSCAGIGSTGYVSSMDASSRPTIYALSSGRPPAAIAVVRLCGPRAGAALEKLIGRLPKPRQAKLARVRDPANGEVIDEALALWFPGPHSETGEDMAELQLHGSPAVVAAVFDALRIIEGCRPAEAGEFTRRAFENGRLDLTAIEGLADLIAAETPAQRRQAFRQLKGLIGDRADAWWAQIISALAQVEARIDFSDEADVPEDLIGPALRVAKELRDEIAGALVQSGRGDRLRDGFVVAIAGPPNAGKSTLLNRLAQRDAAIVSAHPGTTRDAIEVHLNLDGYPVTLIDTAGIRDSADPIEQEGIRRARERVAMADLVLWLTDASAEGTDGKGGGEGNLSAGEVWHVHNKIDRIGGNGRSRSELPSTNKSKNEPARDFSLSALTGSGVGGLVAELSRSAGRFFSGAEAPIATRARHRRALEETIAALGRALAHGSDGSEELIAEDLRSAATALGRLTGRVDVEDLLDVIFRDFCIGK
jgi:tRNA modification GTPase